jgi:protocatechuate 3,4-dioxygenase alpha subunit
MPELIRTPGQTVGPFFHYALPYPGDRELVPLGSNGSVRLHGYVYDGAGRPLHDAMLEIRQADRHGRVPSIPGSMRREGAGFTGWGRSHTDPSGHYWFSTVEPASVDGGLAFFAVTVFARGLLDRLFTRIYLPAPRSVLAAEPLLSSLPDDARGSMVAVREDDGSLRFDIHLQGEKETVFIAFSDPASGS